MPNLRRIVFSALLAAGFTSFGQVRTARAEIPTLLELGKASPSLSASESQGVHELIDEVLRKLPPSLTASLLHELEHPIQLRFEPLDEHSSIVAPPCAGGPANAEVAKLGALRTSFSFFGQSKYIIQIHRAFVGEIAQGPDASAHYGCGHETLYRLAMASIIHEISHVFDALNIPAKQDPRERKIRERCASEGQRMGKFPEMVSEVCSYYMRIQTSVSDRIGFQKLMGWDESFAGPKARNQNGLRSPDPYEFENTEESFAVNMEYFLLDTKFRCRRPSVYAFFSRAFGFAPNADSPCELNTGVRLSSTHTLIPLDPKRVYQIHYLLADKGEDFSSRWGHAMYRIIVCAPERTEVGPDCLKDINHHVVVSYRANILDLKLSYLGGIFGKYPSQLFLLSLPEVIQEYTIGEDRDLQSVPLKLSRGQIESVVHKTLEQYWEYQGRYYFLGNNCATESLHFLQSVLDEPSLKTASFLVTTPKDVFELLGQTHLLDSEHAQTFPAYLKQVRESYALIQSIAPELKGVSLEKYVSDFDAARRRSLYLGSKTSDRVKAAVQFLFLELRVREHLKEALKKSAEVLIEKESNGSAGADAGFKDLSEKLIGLRTRLAPFSMARSGYGIPEPSELAGTDELNSLGQEATDLMARTIEFLKARLGGSYADLDHVSENVQFFMTEIKSGMKLSTTPKNNPLGG